MIRSMHLLVLLFIVCGFLAGCGVDDATGPGPAATETVEPESDGHARMLAALEDVRERTVEEHPFLGTRVLRAAERELEAAKRMATSSPEEMCRLHGIYGEELSRAGRTEEAVREMKTALDLVPATEASKEIRKHVQYRLAVICMRLGENANCVHCTNGASCLLPIRKEGVHTDPTGSRMAAEHLIAVLEDDPTDLRAIWLLNVAHMTLGTYPSGVPEAFRIPESVFSTESPDVRQYRNISQQIGLNTRNPAGGVVIDDFDGDDYLDVLTSSWDTAESARLFRNNRDGTFSERIEEAGLNGIYGGLNLIQADYDNDGDVDVLVLRGAWLEKKGRHPNSLLQNDGSGHFRDVTFDVGLGEVHYPTQTAAWSDMDNDGDLDLFIGNEGYPSQMFENDGQGKFIDVAARAGMQIVQMVKGTAWGDYNQDRWPDLYVSILPGKNQLYRNNQNGTFTNVAAELGVEGPIYSFPTWFWDYNNDGIPDLYIASFDPGNQYVAADYLKLPTTCEPDRLYRGTGDGRFEEVAAEAQLTRVTQPMGSNFGDMNNDGFIDFYLGTGYVDYDGLIPNLMFLNRGGQKYEDVTFAAGVGHLQKGHAVAIGDLDNDGDLDIFSQMGGWFAGDAFPNAVFENPGTQGHWIDVRMVGRRSNRSAIGARIHVVVGEGDTRRDIYRWVNSGGSFGGNPFRQHIGLGSAERIVSLEVEWPTTGERQIFPDLAVDQRIEITESEQKSRTISLQRIDFSASSSKVVKKSE